MLNQLSHALDSTPSGPKKILWDGLWVQNAGIVQLLGLCPLLAVSNTLINGLALGLATMACLLISNTCVSLSRGLIRPEIRIPLYVLIIASSVTAIELLMKAYFYPLYLSLGIFIPLIVTNCMIIGRAEAFASKQPLGLAALDALAVGFGFTLVLIMLGGIREIIGFGTLFKHADLLFKHWFTLEPFSIDHYQGLLLAILPPGAFIGLGLLVALKKIVDRRVN